MAGLSDALFSNVQGSVLALLFGSPERSFYTSEIIKSIDAGTGAVDRELSRLAESGLVTVERIGNQKHFQANRASPIYEELRGIVLKTVGLADPLRAALEPDAKKIVAAFVYGSVAKKSDTAKSDIDLMVIGRDLSYSDLFSGLQKAEATLHRPVNPNIMPLEDWQRKRNQKSFVSKVDAQPKIFIFGSENDLRT
jgi:predicted nucleotidyltransferase